MTALMIDPPVDRREGDIPPIYLQHITKTRPETTRERSETTSTRCKNHPRPSREKIFFLFIRSVVNTYSVLCVVRVSSSIRCHYRRFRTIRTFWVFADFRRKSSIFIEYRRNLSKFINAQQCLTIFGCAWAEHTCVWAEHTCVWAEHDESWWFMMHHDASWCQTLDCCSVTRSEAETHLLYFELIRPHFIEIGWLALYFVSILCFRRTKSS